MKPNSGFPAFLGRIGVFLLLAFVCLPGAAANAVFQDLLQVPRVDGSLLAVHVQRPSSTGKVPLLVYIDGSLAAMQLMLALESLGLSSCSINWPDVEERERQLAKILGLAYQERTVMLLAVGYADPT